MARYTFHTKTTKGGCFDSIPRSEQNVTSAVFGDTHAPPRSRPPPSPVRARHAQIDSSGARAPAAAPGARGGCVRGELRGVLRGGGQAHRGRRPAWPHPLQAHPGTGQTCQNGQNGLGQNGQIGPRELVKSTLVEMVKFVSDAAWRGCAGVAGERGGQKERALKAARQRGRGRRQRAAAPM